MALFGRKKRAAAPVEQTHEAVSTETVPASSEPLELAGYREELLAVIEPLPPIGLGILDAFGRRLCEEIVADIDLPTFTSASVAGYAVRAADLASARPADPVRLPVLDTLDSPVYRGAPLLEHTAVRVAPGAPLPEGADAVIGLDRTDGGDTEVRIEASVTVGQHLRPAGSDIANGTRLLEHGVVLDAGAIGLLAQIGLDKVLVRQPPRVAVLTIGSDLVPPGLPLTSRAQHHDATTSLIAAAAKADGTQVFAAGTFADDAAVITEALTDQLIRADLIVVIGGLDGALPDVLARLGELTVRHVAVHPGGDHAFALVGDDRTPVIALPAGVWPAFVGYHAFVRPALNRLQGEPDELPQTRVLPARVALHSRADATELIPAVATDRGVEPAGDLGSDSARDVARADTLIVLPRGTALVPANSDVEVWMLTPART
ncbi:MAG: molybdopterin molybdotransferase MoeA [Micropruina sp.]